MSKNKTASEKRFSFSSLFANNKVVFVISLILAIVSWCVVSMSETTEIDRVFYDVVVKINIDESVAKNNGLEIFGEQEFKVNVTVRGLSYLVNDSSFTNDDIIVTASCAAVATPGTYDLPLSYSISGGKSNSVEIVNISAKTIKVSFDERITKEFALTEEVVEGNGYSIEENLIRENPRLSVDSITISGPAKEVSKITSVKAHVEINTPITMTSSYEAEIVAMSASGIIDLQNCTIENTDPVYVIIAVKKVDTFNTAVEFTGMPQSYRADGVEYVIYPEKINVTYSIDGEQQENTDRDIVVGTIDFSKINNTENYITITNDQIISDVKSFTVKIDMRDMKKRWLPIAVDVSSMTIPENITILTGTVESVQIIGPEDSVSVINETAAYAVPVLDPNGYEPGIYTVPAKIILRTLQDSWIYGTYTIQIEVK